MTAAAVVAAEAPPSSEAIGGLCQKGAARVRDTGRVGVVIQHDPSDEGMCFKLRFTDGVLPDVDWFSRGAVEPLLDLHAQQQQPLEAGARRTALLEPVSERQQEDGHEPEPEVADGGASSDEGGQPCGQRAPMGYQSQQAEAAPPAAVEEAQEGGVALRRLDVASGLTPKPKALAARPLAGGVQGRPERMSMPAPMLNADMQRLMSLGESSAFEAELIKRNREVASLREEMFRTERRFEETQMRNDELLERAADKDAEIAKRDGTIKTLAAEVARLQGSQNSAAEREARLQEELTTKASTASADVLLERRLAEAEGEREQLRDDLQRERQTHNAAKHALENSQNATQELRATMLEPLQKELETARRRIAELEASQASRSQAEVDKDEKLQAVRARNAQVEGELRKGQERNCEVEGRLEAQRQYIEQLSGMVAQAQADKDNLMATKGGLEAQLQLLKEAGAKTDEDSQKRCRELEETLSRERSAHRDALDMTQRSSASTAEQLAAVRAELLSKTEKQAEELRLLRERLRETEAAQEQAEALRKAAEGQLLSAQGEAQERAAGAEELRGKVDEAELMTARLHAQLDDTATQHQVAIELEVRKRTEAELAAAARIQELSQRLSQAEQTASAASESDRRQREERLSMSAAELFSRQVEFELERQRLEGALTESRRMMRSVMQSGGSLERTSILGRR
eukprot:TRINITY_DN39213_c0_g1_i1.p1 TRINITY_DN39213_c0_g1~~TRINITY_DN39213_c0_g1_i1.p1  ORF type:complete len:692 (-),score=240.81 TRINITY_DN39213_c0_g1_i1:118-2193(-)